MDDFAMDIAIMCPVCGVRPRKIGNPDHHATAPLKTCGDPGCVAALRAQSNRVHVEIKPSGERPVDPRLLRKEGPKTCPTCQGAKWFSSFDGIAWEGCDRCHTGQPIPVIRTPILEPRPVPETKVCSRCGQSKPLREFYFECVETGERSSRCRACQRARMKQIRAAAKLGGRPAKRA